MFTKHEHSECENQNMSLYINICPVHISISNPIKAWLEEYKLNSHAPVTYTNKQQTRFQSISENMDKYFL